MAVEEILVHVASGQDDAYSRRLAKAYDSFVPKNRSSLMLEDIADLMAADGSPEDVAAAANNRQRPAASDSDYVQDTALAVANLQSGILTSSLEDPIVPPELVELQQTMCAVPSTPPVPLSSQVSAETPGLMPPEAWNTTSSPAPNTRGADGFRRTRAQKKHVLAERDADHILPPRAPVGMLPPTFSHVTPELAQLAQNLHISKYYEPFMHKTRDIDHLERGYWAVSTQAWPTALQDKMWTFLNDFVGTGQAGWAVTCWRESLSTTIVGNDPHSSPASMRDKLIKVYCFGELVPYIFLLLYTGSESRVKRTGAEWIDADGQAVVRVSTVESSR